MMSTSPGRRCLGPGRFRPRSFPIALGALMLFGGISSRRGAAEPPIQAYAVEETLKEPSRAAREISGGAFGPEGWTAGEQTDYLRYELPEGARSGTVEFQVKGIRIGAEGDARKHAFAVTDRYLGPKARYRDTNCTIIMVRVWTNPRDGSQPGKTRLRNIGLAYGPPDTKGAKFQADSPPLDWDPDRWYTFRIAWTQAEVVFERDGQALSRLSFPDKDVPFRHVFINMGYYGPDMFGLSDVIFRNVKIRAS